MTISKNSALDKTFKRIIANNPVPVDVDEREFASIHQVQDQVDTN